MCIYGAVDDLYQKNARFSKLKLFTFSIRSVRLSTVLYEGNIDKLHVLCDLFLCSHDLLRPSLFIGSHQDQIYALDSFVEEEHLKLEVMCAYTVLFLFLYNNIMYI